jgi:hypothetical protein
MYYLTFNQKMEIEHSSTQATICSGMDISSVASVFFSHIYLKTSLMRFLQKKLS